MKIKTILIIFSSVFFIQSCSIYSLTQSTVNDVNSEGIELSEDFKLYSTGVIFMNMAGVIKLDFLPASFRIEYRDKLIYIDPIVINDTAKADYIFITHVHNDHFSKLDITKIADSKTIIIAPEPVTKKLKGYNTKTIKIGDKPEFGDIKCEAVYAYNLQKGFMGMTLHPKGNNNVGYVISFGSIRIYHAGDTDFIPEMLEIKNIDLALLPIGESKTAMNPKSAAEATNIIKPKTVVPVHYKVGLNKVKDFSKLVNKDIKIYSLRK